MPRKRRLLRRECSGCPMPRCLLPSGRCRLRALPCGESLRRLRPNVMKSEAAFWDTSALVPLCCYQEASAATRGLARRYRRMTVWWGTRVEAYGTLARLHWHGDLSEAALGEARARLAVLSRSWLELLPVERVREYAEDLLGRYHIRAADALQLAAALAGCHEHPQQRVFVCLDARLGEAASRVGFQVVGN